MTCLLVYENEHSYMLDSDLLEDTMLGPNAFGSCAILRPKPLAMHHVTANKPFKPSTEHRQPTPSSI